MKRILIWYIQRYQMYSLTLRLFQEKKGLTKGFVVSCAVLCEQSKSPHADHSPLAERHSHSMTGFI